MNTNARRSFFRSFGACWGHSYQMRKRFKLSTRVIRHHRSNKSAATIFSSYIGTRQPNIGGKIDKNFHLFSYPSSERRRTAADSTRRLRWRRRQLDTIQQRAVLPEILGVSQEEGEEWNMIAFQCSFALAVVVELGFVSVRASTERVNVYFYIGTSNQYERRWKKISKNISVSCIVHNN